MSSRKFEVKLIDEFTAGLYVPGTIVVYVFGLQPYGCTVLTPLTAVVVRFTVRQSRARFSRVASCPVCSPRHTHTSHPLVHTPSRPLSRHTGATQTLTPSDSQAQPVRPLVSSSAALQLDAARPLYASAYAFV